MTHHVEDPRKHHLLSFGLQHLSNIEVESLISLQECKPNRLSKSKLDKYTISILKNLHHGDQERKKELSTNKVRSHKEDFP